MNLAAAAAKGTRVPARTTPEVLEDHLRRRAAGDLDGELAKNYGEDIVLLCKHGVFVGCEAIRASADMLGLQIPNSHFVYVSSQTHGDYGFLEWRAESDRVRIDDGADSYVIRDGRIRMQTIHYTRRPKGDGVSGRAKRPLRTIPERPLQSVRRSFRQAVPQ